METRDSKKVSLVLLRVRKPAMRDKILKASKELFYKYGVKRMTMDDIAKHLAVSKKTLYQFFEDKEQIVNAQSELTILEHQKSFEKIHQEAIDPIDEFFSVSKHMGIILSEINPIFFYDLQKFYPEVWKKFLDFKMECACGMLEKNLTEGIKSGLYRKEINVKILARYRMLQIDTVLNHETFPPQQFNIIEVNQMLLELFMHGITTIKGHKLINKYKEIEDEE